MQTTLLKEHKAIDQEDLELFTIVDSVDEAYENIINNVSC